MAVVRHTWSPGETHDSEKSVKPRELQAVVVTARGRWSNADVYLDVPSSWAGAGVVELTLWALCGTARAALVTVTLSATPLVTLGTRVTGRVAWVRGAVADGFEVTLKNNTNVELGAGRVYLSVWGTESTPEAAGELQNDAGRVQALPVRESRLSAWSQDYSLYQRIQATEGALHVFEPGAVATFSGSAPGTASTVPSTDACALVELGCTNSSAAVVYLLVFDKASAPTALEIPVAWFAIPAASACTPGETSVRFHLPGFALGNGCALGVSTTPTAYNSAGAVGWFWWAGRGA